MEEVIKKAIEGGYREDIVQIHKNMKQEIEQIIRKNLPEKKENPKNKCINAENHSFGRCFSCEKNNGFNDCLDEINTSLIADEVLKVVVEKLEKVFDKHCNYSPKKIESEEEYGYNKGLMAEAKLLKFEILQLLSEHPSPNKENKNND